MLLEHGISPISHVMWLCCSGTFHQLLESSTSIIFYQLLESSITFHHLLLPSITFCNLLSGSVMFCHVLEPSIIFWNLLSSSFTFSYLHHLLVAMQGCATRTFLYILLPSCGCTYFTYIRSSDMRVFSHFSLFCAQVCYLLYYS
ncbi:hypothetical protein DL96DRAFT_436712 [Flagelloscypha sp. PMI_526]|nr:hypothetical protein DL96DRAFT_436712 [Flagelloscypha sp. PMI_526]